MYPHPRGWEEAAIVDENGSIDRPVDAASIAVPAVIELSQNRDRLLWQWGDGDSSTMPGPGMLDAFVHLTDAQPERIRDYARRWGILGICKHGLPATHNPPPPGGIGPSHQRTWCYPLGWVDERCCWEPIEAWRLFAAQARGLLNIAAQLHDDQPGRLEDWQNIYYQRACVAVIVNEWLGWGNVRPVFEWPIDRSPDVKLGGGALFRALAVQLMLSISRTDGLAICSACGIPYVPSRRPPQGRRNYCHECGIRAARRDASREYRRRRGRPDKD